MPCNPSLPACQLASLLADLDSAAVECDGMSRLVATRLHRAGIDYTPFEGSFEFKGRVVHPHFWIEVGDLVIDYRARMWLRDDPEVAYGVFPRDSIEGRYKGRVCNSILPLSKLLEQILSMPLPDEIQAALKKKSGMGM
ncbi:TPA: hypothetical protein ACKP0X_003768 [Pseudomonas aeruginosa]